MGYREDALAAAAAARANQPADVDRAAADRERYERNKHKWLERAEQTVNDWCGIVTEDTPHDLQMTYKSSGVSHKGWKSVSYGEHVTLTFASAGMRFRGLYMSSSGSITMAVLQVNFADPEHGHFPIRSKADLGEWLLRRPPTPAPRQRRSWWRR